MPPPLTDLNQDATAEILLRLPPDEPEHLFRAALVCKPWLRIVRDPGFLRRYRAFHGAPPLPGLRIRFLHTPMGEGEPVPRLVPTTSVPAFPQPAGTDRILDCRHGRVLVRTLEDGVAEDTGDGDRGYLLVWDPVTGHSHALPQPGIRRRGYSTNAAAVLCATQGCNHLECHGGPFGVAFLATRANTIFATIYLSETGAWSTPTSVCIGSAVSAFYTMRGTVLLGDEICFALLLRPQTDAFATVKYDWGKNCLTLMDSPPPPPPHQKVHGVALMAMEDSSLGLAVTVDSSLHIYSRKVNIEGATQWVRRRLIDLEKVMPMAKHCGGDGPRVVGFAEGVGAVFVSTGAGLFTIELKSGQVKKVDEPATGFGYYFPVLPYMSFYTPDRVRLSSLIARGLPDV